MVPERGTRLIQVSFQSHDQNQAAQVANELVEAYKSNYRQTHYDATTETSGWLTTQLTDLKTNVEEAEKKLTEFEKANGDSELQYGYPRRAGWERIQREQRRLQQRRDS